LDMGLTSSVSANMC